MYHRDQPGASRDVLLDFLMEAAGRLLDQAELHLKRGQAEARHVDGTVLLACRSGGENAVTCCRAFRCSATA